MKLTLLLSALFVVLFTGCSHDSNLEQTVDEDASDYEGASCAFKYDEGEKALSLRSPLIQQTHFKKQFDQSLLNPVLRSSSQELVRFAETNDVTFYRTEGRTSNGCSFAQSLTPAPSDLENKFDEVDFRKGLLGLYLPENSENLPSIKSSSAIIVRIDTNKWVLIHEYMHHLFRLQEMKDGYDSSNAALLSAQSEILLESSFLGFRTSTSKASKAQDVLAKLKAYNTYGIELFRTYAGEEMTIESILGDRMDNGSLGFVHTKQRMNGAGYIVSNSKRAKSLLTDIETINSKVSKEISAYLNASETQELNRLSSELKTVDSEIDGLVNKAKAYARTQGYSFRGLSQNPSGLHDSDHMEIPHDAGCSHGEIPVEVSERIKNLAERL